MKTIMVIALLLVCFTASADWLSVDMAFQAGWIPNGNICFYQTNLFIPFEPFDAVFNIDMHLFRFIRFGGQIISNFSLTNNGLSPINFTPSGMTYLFFAGFEPVKGLSIIYEHSCSHPVAPYLSLSNGIDALDAGYDRVYLELKTHIEF